MTICYFGDYNPEYARNRVLIKGLKENSVEILECNSQKRGWAKYFEIYQKHKAFEGSYDFLIVAQSDKSRLVWFAKLLSRKKIVWDIFYSFYDKYVFDAKVISSWNVRGWYQWLREWLAANLADVCLYDTESYIDFFVKTFKVRRGKFLRVLIGADEDLFYPEEKKRGNDIFLAHFHGNFIAVQGVPYIILAAKHLKTHQDIRFQLIGAGQKFKEAVSLAEKFNLGNVSFLGRKTHEEINGYLIEADVSLGNFGDTDKTLRVVATKTYESLAAKVAVISADTPAMREIFTDRENILFCQRANPDDLAKKILELKNNPELRMKIAEGGYRLYLKRCTPKIIVTKLLEDLKSLNFF